MPLRLLIVAAPFMLTSASIAAGLPGVDHPTDPLAFFDGRTEYVSTMKLMARKPYRSRTLGHGEIAADGSLRLVQKVQDDGKPSYERRWLMRQIGPGRFGGTMTEAKGPVLVEEVGGSYRFRFRMRGHISVEQWLTPLPGGTKANSKLTVRKFGLVVGRSEGSVRKL